MENGDTRTESDSMGKMEVPKDALWGASTQRAVENFPILGQGVPPRLIRALGLVKHAAAVANRDLGLLDKATADVIIRAATEVHENKLDTHFVVDVFQTGSGTSSNMNANEVISNRASQLLGGQIGSKKVHPNDHVNMGQSSNDVFPTAMHVAAVEALVRDLVPALTDLRDALSAKAEAFADTVKIGRTHLMDAVPIMLGQEFSGWAAQVDNGIHRVENTLPRLSELAIGGTAVGTGINTHPEFGTRVADGLNGLTDLGFNEATNHFEAQAARDAYVEASGALKTVATSLMKIANDIRLLASGPSCGIGEIQLPATQPGSSIMPGKVNPVICESVVQVGAQVTGNDLAVTLGGQWGQLDLNVMCPMMARNLLESVSLLTNVSRVFADKCVKGIEANEAHARDLIEKSMAMVTSLNPYIGYDKAAKIAKTAHESGRTVREVAKEMSGLDDETLDRALDPKKMTKPSAKL
ncbi:MAG: class II fumarate hydratase [Euryarchaeota archaeon]|nr:class II fumarate hydratase [Euryarchaeota archaeon]